MVSISPRRLAWPTFPTPRTPASRLASNLSARALCVVRDIDDVVFYLEVKRARLCWFPFVTLHAGTEVRESFERGLALLRRPDLAADLRSILAKTSSIFRIRHPSQEASQLKRLQRVTSNDSHNNCCLRCPCASASQRS